jgi:hypothetical protein
MKTLKQSEMDILFEDGFLVEYYQHLMENQKSLLCKIFGIYEVKIKR